MIYVVLDETKKLRRLKNNSIFCITKELYKQGSTRQGKKLSNFSIGLKTAKQFEKLYFQYLTGNVK